PGVNLSGAAVVTVLDGGVLIGPSAGLRLSAQLAYEAAQITGTSADDFWVLDGYDKVVRYLDGGVLDLTPSFAESRWSILVRPGDDVWLVGSRIRRYDGAGGWSEVVVTLPGPATDFRWRSVRELGSNQLGISGLQVRPDGGLAPVFMRLAIP
ncbi:MAG: hypothetical protein JNK82_15320, partial [Myxococcaceae bacterium]|nr:hypothetical protein [Myxococcaceae bacterium]